jgi:hypothetical protein
MLYTIALFGESERGDFRRPYYCQNLAQLSDFLGEPPSEECQGLKFAIQALLYHREVIFLRVHEEGFSTNDYLKGLVLLEDREKIPNLSAIGLPGVGNTEIIEATTPICESHRSFLILTQHDLYDFLTYAH